MPYKKGILWAEKINDIENNGHVYKQMKNILKDNLFVNHSKIIDK